MNPNRRLVLAANDPCLASSLSAHLARAIQSAPMTVRIEEVPELLTPQTDGKILLTATDPTEVDRIEIVVREARVQQLPVSLGVVETEAVRTQRLTEPLLPYLNGRWVWPHQSRELIAQVCRSLEPGTPFPNPAADTAAQRIRRRLINYTPSLTALVDPLTIAAEHDVTVLIEGETGTGKTHLARLIHDHSRRSGRRFVMMSCATLTGQRLAGELFGCSPGTPEVKIPSVGKLAVAREGTLVLDEIQALSHEHQADLLRVIETGEYEPLGSDETLSCTARIIATTTASLAEAVEQGSFRRDLFYRLHVIALRLSPLRHRPEDIGPLVRGMVARYGTRFGKRLYSVHPEALQALEAYPWPGNIRQLENIIQQSVLATTGSELKLEHLPPMVLSRFDGLPPASRWDPAVGGTLRQSREAIERANILRALETAGQCRTRAAQLLGVSRVTLYKKMKKYGLLDRSERRPSFSSGPIPIRSGLDATFDPVPPSG